MPSWQGRTTFYSLHLYVQSNSINHLHNNWLNGKLMIICVQQEFEFLQKKKENWPVNKFCINLDHSMMKDGKIFTDTHKKVITALMQ